MKTLTVPAHIALLDTDAGKALLQGLKDRNTRIMSIIDFGETFPVATSEQIETAFTTLADLGIEIAEA